MKEKEEIDLEIQKLMKKARDVSYGQKTLGSLILKAQKSFIHEKWQGRESKIRTISRGTVLFLAKPFSRYVLVLIRGSFPLRINSL